jgi:hypothetical protein
MNYIKHLTGFFEKVTADKSLNPTHISLYIALFQFWNCNRFKNPISISREEVMRISKISSKVTYHKCLKELHGSGYIKYEPSYNPFKGSHVFLFNFSDDLKPLSKSERKSSNFEPVTEQVADKSRTGTETSSEPLVEQALVPSINNTNILNIKNNSKGLNENPPIRKIEEIDSNLKIVSHQKKEEKSSAKKEEQREMPEEIFNFQQRSSSPAFADYTAEQTESSRQKKLRQKKKDDAHFVGSSAVEKPTLKEVIFYFTQENIPQSEAVKFYNYNQSIGWIIGGKSPITDWKSAANNWILKIPNFHHHEPNTKTKHLDSSAEKDYYEPL